MVEIQNLTRLLRTLEKYERTSQQQDNGNVVVGYAASYALVVHEDMKAKHKVGQAKFLEQPAREKQREIVANVVEAMTRGASLVKALLSAGLFLQRESQKLVPVDTGNLRGSAFTERE